MIHVMATCARASSIQVARELAAASAFRFGRTLLVAANQDNEPVPIVRGLSWLMSTLGSEETNNVMPDSSLAGLHHIQLDPDGTAPLPITTWLDLPQNFQMIVVAGAASAIDPRSAGEAARCNGSLLAVAAGISRLDDVRAAGRLLTYAGANVLGTVLYDAPRLELGFPRLRRAG